MATHNRSEPRARGLLAMSSTRSRMMPASLQEPLQFRPFGDVGRGLFAGRSARPDHRSRVNFNAPRLP
jgi:hypothetical protein